MTLTLTLLLIFGILTEINVSNDQTIQRPNILFIFVDDVGFNDFGFNENTQTQTPFIDNLLNEESLLIKNNYVSFVCSPTRAQMLSGRYASHLGLQHNVFTENVPYSLTRQVSLLSNEFQSNSYSTHLIGKFHLGYQAWEYTPNYRGFDTFQGFYNGEETYFTHQAYVKGTDLLYYDLRDNEEEDHDITTYSVYKHRDQFLNLMDNINDNDNDNPFFIYLAFQAAHYPPQAPIEYSSLYCDPYNDDDEYNINIMNVIKPPYQSDDDASNGDVYLNGNCTAHDIHMAQMTSIDDAMQIIINRLKQDSNIWDNTLIIFSSDNGGAMFSGDNAPLRGGKGTPFQGGVRVPAFISGGYLAENRRGKVLDEISVHVTDWYQTLLTAANLNVNYQRSKKLHSSTIDDTKWDYIDEYDIKIPIDGKDIWNAIQNNIIDQDLIDREILIHLDEIDCEYESCGALIYKNWKYLRGPYICEGYKCGWNNQWMINPDNNILNCAMTANNQNITMLINRKKSSNNQDDDDDDTDWSLMSCSDGCLFNLDTDPCEYNDVKDVYPDIVEIMENKLLLHQENSVKPLMGENEIYLSDDEINPTIVCNSEYWCPYMNYDDVEFEQTLYSEYMRLYAQVDNDNNDNEDIDGIVVLHVIGLFTILSICCILYINYLLPSNKEVIGIIDLESHPLIQK